MFKKTKFDTLRGLMLLEASIMFGAMSIDGWLKFEFHTLILVPSIISLLCLILGLIFVIRGTKGVPLKIKLAVLTLLLLQIVIILLWKN